MNVASQQPSEVLLIAKLNLPIAKTLNGSVAGGNTGCMLRSRRVTVRYKKANKWQEKKEKTYIIKGIRGAVRHAVMKECKNRGIEVCHTTNKEEDKSKNKLLVDGFHLLGSCAGDKECIVHQIFGSMRQESIISVHTDPIIYIDERINTYEFFEDLQVVHIATEKRLCLTYDRKSAQNFNDKYFSGEIHFKINVSKCTPIQIGLLISAIINMKRVGGGYNSGYSHSKTLSINLVEQVEERSLVWNQKNKEHNIKEEIKEKNKKKLLLQSVEAWKNYRG